MNTISDNRTRTGSRLVKVCCYFTAGLSLLALAGWELGLPVLAGVRLKYIPMAPSTALSLLLLSLSLFLHTHLKAGRFIRILGLATLPPVVLFCAYKITVFFGGYADVEDALVRYGGAFRQVAAGHMSPITAANLLVAAAALAVMYRASGTRDRSKDAASLSASLVVILNMVLILGYLYGIPMLYGGRIVPVALTTAISFLFLGTGLVTEIGPDHLPLRLFAGTSTRAILLRTILPLSVAFVLLSDFLELTVPSFTQVKTPLLSALSALAAAVCTGVVMSHVARRIGNTIDLTQEELRRERSRLETASTAAQVGLWEWDITSGALEWSGAVDAMLGYGPGTFPRSLKAWEEIIHPEDRGPVIDMLAAHIEKGVAYDVEYRVMRKDGSLVWWHDVGSAQRDERGRAYKMSGACTDITERKRAGEILRASEEQYRTTIDSMSDAIGLVDKDLRVIMLNGTFRRWCRELGLKVTGTGQYLFDLFPFLKEKVRDEYRYVFDTGRMLLTEEVNEVSGRVIVTETRKIPIVEKGEVVRVVTVVRDITERKRADEELKKVKNYLANVFNSMPSLLASMNLDGTITQWNQEAEKATGIHASEAVGKPISALLPDFTRWIEALRSEVEQRRPALMEKLVVEKGGESRFYDLMLYPLVANCVEGVVVRIEDVTERTRIQELMIQTEKMMSVGGLAAGMAHEINNPLGIITQAVQNIERRLSEELPANRLAAEELGIRLDLLRSYLEKREIGKFIGSIREASARAGEIVVNMLQFSRRSAGGVRPASLEVLIDQALGLAASDYDLKKKYDFRDISIVRQYETGIPQVPVIAVEIEQVILNLLKNAAQAMCANPPGRRPVITLRTRLEEKHVVIEVEDNGPGMDERVKRRVFEPFFTTKEPGMGTGLGLSVSYMIVTVNHKGFMSVQSSPDKGACFTIRLPLEQEG